MFNLPAFHSADILMPRQQRRAQERKRSKYLRVFSLVGGLPSALSALFFIAPVVLMPLHKAIAQQPPSAASASVATHALPGQHTIVHGSADVLRGAGTLTVNQSTDQLITNWTSFNIGANASVRFNQPSASSVALNRVDVSGGSSQILGNLSSNGKVFLVNPNGVYFGANAQVNTGSLVASTLDVKDSDFLAGRYKFEGASNAEVRNDGRIAVPAGGAIALIGKTIANNGMLSAPGGAALLGAGERVQLTLQGGYTITVDAAALKAQIDNKGAILADGGIVVLTAGARNSLMQTVVNHTGFIQARRLSTGQGGSVKLEGNYVAAVGTTDASAAPAAVEASIAQQLAAKGIATPASSSLELSAPSAPISAGGQIEIQGRFVALGGQIRADGASRGGSILISSSGALSLADQVSARGLGPGSTGGTVRYEVSSNVTEISGSVTNVSAAVQGGVIELDAAGAVASSGHYQASAKAADGQGGRIDISGGTVRLLSAELRASGSGGGGIIRVGGGFQGGKETDPAAPYHQAFVGRNGVLANLRNSRRTFVNDSSLIDVSSSQGSGGTAIVWSDAETTQLGSIRATGGTSPQGGAVEISSAGNLRHAGLAKVSLGQGHLLLDPQNIIIGDVATVRSWSYQAVLGSGYAVRDRDASGLDLADEFGTSVSLNAAGDRLAVGALGDDGAGNATANSGAVYLYSFTDTQFTGGALQSIIGSGYTGSKNINQALDVDDNFGSSISLNAAGDRLAVGALGDDGAGNAIFNSGAVYLYSFTDTQFTGGALQSTIGSGYTGFKNINQALGIADRFGSSVSLNAAGDRLAVGAPEGNGAGGLSSSSGAVYLYNFTDTQFTNGVLQSTIGSGYTGFKNINQALDTGDNFGTSVSLNAAGDRLAVGARRDAGVGNTIVASGAVYLYSFTDTQFTGGTLQSTIGRGYTGSKNINQALDTGDNFGSSVSLNAAGDRLAVGALGDSGAGNTALGPGAVYLYSFTDTNFSGGALQSTIGSGYSGAKNINQALDNIDRFGASVSLNAVGDRLAVAARSDDGAGNAAVDSGAVYLYSFTDTNFTGGVLQGTIGRGYTSSKSINQVLDNLDRFGNSVSLNAAGDRLAVGAQFEGGAGNAASNSGAVYLYSFTDTQFSGGALQSTIGRGYTGGKNIDQALDANDFFGSAVSLNAAGDRLAVGALGDAGAGNTNPVSGAVYLYSFTDANFSRGTLQATIGRGYSGGKNISQAQDAVDFFGAAVSLNAAGDRLAVGASRDDGASNAAPESGAIYLYSFTDTQFSGGALQSTIGRGYSGVKDINQALDNSDLFGSAVSLNAAGDRLAVGASGDGGAGNAASNSGAVYLYSFTDTQFSGGALQSTIGRAYSGVKEINQALDAGDNFGSSVSLNAAGDRLAVGAPQDAGASNAVALSGAVYLYSFTDTQFSGGALQSTIGRGYSGVKDLNQALDNSDFFGSSLSLNAAGDRLAVGALGDDGAGNPALNSGAVYLYRFTDANFSGGQLASLIQTGHSPGNDIDVSNFSPNIISSNDGFGRAVALNAAGNRLAVGMLGDAGAGDIAAGSGSVQLFSFNDTNYGGATLRSTLGRGYTGGNNLNLTSLDAGDAFGSSVALNAAGDRLAVGSPGDAGAGNLATGSGAVRLFTFADNLFTSPAQTGTVGKGYTGAGNLDVAALGNGDAFGSAVALSANGQLLAVGAPLDDGAGNNLVNTGAVHLFNFADTSFGTPAYVNTIGRDYPGATGVVSGTVNSADRFGSAVALNAAGDRLAAGAARDNGLGSGPVDSGSVHLISFSGPNFAGGALQGTIGNGYTGGKNLNITLDAGDLFGSAVALNAAGDQLIVGAPGDAGSGNVLAGSGAVRVFTFTDNGFGASPFTGAALQATLGQSYTGGRNLSIPLGANEQFGAAVASNAAGDRLAVGAPGDDGPGDVFASNGGAVYLFTARTELGPTPLADAASYGSRAAETITVSRAELESVLSQGTSVSLLASNDITLSGNLTVNNTSGNGGNLNLNAGRSVLLNGSVITDNGNFSATANTPQASGVLDQYRLAGAAVITMATGTSINAGTGDVSLRIDAGTGLTNSTSGNLTLRAITADEISLINLGPTAGSGMVFNGAVNGRTINATANNGGFSLVSGSGLVASGTGDALVLAGNRFVNSAGASALSAANGRWLVYSATPASDTRGIAVDGTSVIKRYNCQWGGIAGSCANAGAPSVPTSGNVFLYSVVPTLNVSATSGTAVYGSAAATPTLTGSSGYIDLDVFGSSGITGSLGLASASFSNSGNANVGSYAVNAGNLASTLGYQINFAGAATQTITARTLTVSATGGTRVYDGGLTAPVTYTDDRISGDILTTAGTAAFLDKNAGNGKTVNITGIAATGTDAGNYSVNTTAATTANITARSLNVSASGVNRVYDATTNATVTYTDDRISGDILTTAGTAAFLDKNAGNGKTVNITGIAATGTDAGNYSVNTTAATTANITARSLNVSASGVNRVYDATTNATVTYTDDRISGDILTTAGTAAFLDKNAGNGKTVNITGIAATGTDAGNYSVNTTAATTANITARSLNVSASGVNRVYDATTNATVTYTDDRISGDILTTAGTAAFLDKNAGNGKTVNITGIAATGTDAGNYSVNTTAATTANITARSLNVSASGVNRVYDATTNATVTYTDDRISGDILTTAGTAAFLDKNAGNGKTVNITGIAATGTDAGNYSVNTTAATTANITARSLNVSASGVNRVYDATTNATVTYTDDRISGDILTTAGTAAFLDKNAGNGKTVNITGIAATGTDAGNYSVNTTAATTANITARSLNVSASGVNRVYDATTNATVTYTDDRISGDILTTAGTAAFLDKNAGNGKTVNITGIAATGTDAGNYSVNTTAATTANITARSLNVSASGVNRVYDATTNATVTYTDDRISGDILTTAGTAAFLDKNAGNGKTVNITGIAATGTDAGNYSVNTTAATTANITARSLNVSASGVNRVYDATTNATVTYTDDRISGDILTTAGTAAFLDKNAGNGKTVNITGIAATGTDAGNYSVNTTAATTANITARSLNVSASGVNRVYDATTNATVTYTDDRISGDILTTAGTAAFLDKNAGNGKTVNITGIAATGTDAGNYSVNTTAATTANITARSLNVSASGVNRVYDATTNATVTYTDDRISGDILTTAGTAAFLDKNAGNGKTVNITGIAATGTDAGNYSVNTTAATTANITARSLNVSASGVNRVYDATTNATVTYTDDRISGDILTTAGTAAFLDKNAGNGKTVNITGIAATGTDAGNYSVNTTAATTANITARSLNVSASGVNRVYDATTNATVTYTDDRISGDILTTAGTAAFLDKNAGNGKTVNITGIAATGTDAGNYSVNTTAATTANITARSLNVSASGVNRVYDATTNATVTYTDDRISGDILTTAGTAAFLDKNAGNGKTVNITGIAATGTDAGNYSVNTTAATTANITARSLNVSASGVNRVYDATTNATVTYTDDRISGDILTTAGTAAFLDKNAGNGKTVNITGIAATGTDAGNYSVNTTAATTANITARSLNVSASGVNRVYDATTNATVTYTDDRISGDILTTAGTAAFLDKNAGNGKTVNITGIAATGTDAGNYSVNTTAATTANITARSLNVSASGVNRVYDATTNATVTYTDDRISGDILTTAGTAAFLDKNAGNGKTVNITGIAATGTDAGNYSVNTTAATTANITARSLNVSASGVNRVYDATTNATVTYTDDRISGDILTTAGTAAFLDKNAGNGKTVNITGIAATGTDAGNYSVNTTAATTANITARSLNVSASGVNRVYDATTNATVTYTDDRISGDILTTAGTAAFLDKNAGNGKTVNITGIAATGTDAGNYSVNTTAATTANITARSLNVSASGVNRVYDATTNATVTYTDDRISGDILTTAGTAAFLDKNAGNGKTVNITGIAATGTDAGNYSVNTTAATTANITARSLNVSASGVNRVYDATTNATVTYTDDRISGDILTTAGTAAFLDKNAGNGKTVNITGIAATGTDAGNYVLANTTSSTSADVTARALVLQADDQTRVYGNTDPSLSYTIVGLAAGDSVASITNGQLNRTNGENVGNYAINQGSLLVNSNYSVSSFQAGNLSITPAPLQITAIDALGMAGQPLPTFGTTISGLRLGDTASQVVPNLSVSTSATPASRAGIYSLLPTGSATGSRAGNYSISFAPGILQLDNAFVIKRVEQIDQNPQCLLNFPGHNCRHFLEGGVYRSPAEYLREFEQRVKLRVRGAGVTVSQR